MATSEVIHVLPGGDTQAAVDRAADAGGGVVEFDGPGEYRGFKVIGRHFTEASPLTVRGATGAAITRGVNTGEGVNLEGVSHVHLDRLAVTGMSAGLRAQVAGVRVVEASHVRVSRCNATGNKTWGFFAAFADHLRYEQCLAGGSVEQHGFYASNSSRHVTHLACASDGNRACGYHNNGDASQDSATGRPKTGLVEDVLYEMCTATGNGVGGGATMNFDGCRRVAVRRCQLLDCRAGGLAFFRADGAAPCEDFTVEGCVVEAAAGGRNALRVADGSDRFVVWGNRVRGAAVKAGVFVEHAGAKTFVSNWNRFELAAFATGDDENERAAIATWRARTGQDRDSVTEDGPVPEPPSPAPTPPRPEYAAEVVSVDVPESGAFGEEKVARVTLRNAGRRNLAGDFRLGTPDDSQAFGFNRMTLPEGVEVPPGGTGTVSSPMRFVTPGTLRLAPVIEGVRRLAGPVVVRNISIPFGASPTPKPWGETVGDAAWVLGNPGFAEHDTGGFADPRKLLFSPLPFLAAQVRAPEGLTGDDRVGLCVGCDAAGRGYNLVLRPDGLYLLHDYVTFGERFNFNWAPGAWYGMRLEMTAAGVRGKCWEEGSAEPDWQVSAVWPLRSGLGGFNGGAAAASFRPLG